MNSASELLIELLFLNNKFKINKKCFILKNGQVRTFFVCVKDLFKEDGTFLNVQTLNQKYYTRVQFLEYLGCINVIKAY